tara:strand:+ start:3184 stop:3573 length:390 start_codon:yes stop_codon:yes gene_type:complete
MKNTILTFIFLFSITMWTSNGYGEWKFLTSSEDGTKFYIDFESVRKHEGYYYYWVLEDLLKPDIDGDLSYINYFQGDCNLFRIKHLSGLYYKLPMGEGNSYDVNPENPKWSYVPPGSVFETSLKTVCGM